jgi:transcriptional regulator with XRE-family HTH domain
MWLDNLKELKKNKGMSSKQIAEATNLPERTVVRIFSGDTDNPYVDTLRRIVAVLGGSLDDLFAESKIVVANTDLIALQAEHEQLLNDFSRLQAENVMLKDKVVTLEAENDRLRLTLAHKEEIISLHNYYNKLKPNN